MTPCWLDPLPRLSVVSSHLKVCRESFLVMLLDAGKTKVKINSAVQHRMLAS